MSKTYIVYDQRALYSVDDATVISADDSFRSARADAKDYGGVVFEYDVDEKKGVLSNGVLVFNPNE